MLDTTTTITVSLRESIGDSLWVIAVQDSHANTVLASVGRRLIIEGRPKENSSELSISPKNLTAAIGDWVEWSIDSLRRLDTLEVGAFYLQAPTNEFEIRARTAGVS